jgi:transaldolase
VAVADAVERGLARRASTGYDTSGMTPLCVFLIGRTDDWFAALAERDGRKPDPGFLEWPGIACLKAAYDVYRARGFRTRLLVAGFRREQHWSAFVGGDLVISMTPAWARRVEASTAPVHSAIDEPVAPAMLAALSRAFPEFARALAPDGFEIDEFDGLAPMVRTLRGFLRARHELLAFVADALLPDPFAPAEAAAPRLPDRGALQE